MMEKAENHSKKCLEHPNAFNISADIFLLFNDGKIPSEARNWLKLYVKRHIKMAREFQNPTPPQLRLIHTQKDVLAANIYDEFQTSEDDHQYFAELDQNERIQLRLHGLLAFLLFARQCPAIIIADNNNIKKLCADSEPDTHVQDLIDDAFIIFVTDHKGMQSAQERQLHVVPWEDQSQ